MRRIRQNPIVRLFYLRGLNIILTLVDSVPLYRLSQTRSEVDQRLRRKYNKQRIDF